MRRRSVSVFLIAVIDRRFGGVMPDGKTSITEAEIDAALANGRQVLVFVRQSVWDAKEAYSAFRKDGHPFTPSGVVEDQQVLDLIDRIRRRARSAGISRPAKRFGPISGSNPAGVTS